MEVVPWKNLRIGKKYFVVTTSYSEEKKPVVIHSLTFMNQGEAMIQETNPMYAYAVGGMFEGPGGPKNVFWTDSTEDYSEDPVSAQPPPPLDLSGIQMSEDDWAMAYGLRRCRICGYNEGPESCPNNCYENRLWLDQEKAERENSD
jgi:hypothetical protein